jgi:hypothetical protein
MGKNEVAVKVAWLVGAALAAALFVHALAHAQADKMRLGESVTLGVTRAPVALAAPSNVVVKSPERKPEPVNLQENLDTTKGGAK